MANAIENHWFIAVVTPNTEKASREKLEKLIADLNKEKKYNESVDEKKRVISYVPIQREMHEWPSTGKRVWVDRVICPCYVFIRCSDADRYYIACRAKFIHHFLMDRARISKDGRNDFARIPHPQMLNFIRMVGDGDSPITIDPTRLRAGSKVRIKTGRLRGIEAFLEESPNGTTSIALRVNFLGYAKMNCPIELLELIE